MKLISINVSQPKPIEYNGKIVHTGIFKEPVSGTVMLRENNIDGDGQGDLKAHGGTYKAIYGYPIEHYSHWKQQLNRDDLSYGQFGENLTVEGMLEKEVHIGDVFRIGSDVQLQITQPRVPCFKLGYKMGMPEFPKQFLESRLVGFYFRVLSEGEITVGDTISRIEVASESMSITEILSLRYFDTNNHEKIAKARKLPALSPSWKKDFIRILRAKNLL
ncbi:MOSC domain-containing protein [Candidatus Poribacteria bacterium]|nr:MOSC domain-containing protein [Candidatus Poribacteria bacterium]